ncbi:MAG: TolC family protein [Clostridia bacterium]
MKRKISLFLVLAMCITTLTTSGTESEEKVYITYDEVYDMVLENNQSIQSNKLALKVMKNPPGVAEAQDALWSASQGMNSLLSTMNDALLMVKPASEYPLYMALTAGIMSISNMKSEISSQMISLNSQTDEEMEGTIKQFESIEQQIIWGAQSLYMAYIGLDLTVEELLISKNSLETTVVSLEKRYELGQISALDLSNVKINIINLNSALETLEYEQEKLLYDLNILLGRDYGTTLTLSHDIVPDVNYFSNISFEDDFVKVLENNYNYYTVSESFDDAKDTHTSLDNTASQNNYDMARINLEIQEQSLKSSLNKIYLQIAEKQRLVSVEKEILLNKEVNLTAQELKYSHGTISLDELNATQAEYDTQALKVKTANFNFFIAIEQYKWALNGMITG